MDSRRGGLRVAWRAGAGPLLVAGRFAARCSAGPPAPSLVPPPIPEGVDDLPPLLEDVWARFHLPGMVAAVFDADGIRAVGVAGTRRVGSGVPLLYTDRLQIASIAKTMTATLVAKLIEDESPGDMCGKATDLRRTSPGQLQSPNERSPRRTGPGSAHPSSISRTTERFISVAIQDAKAC